MLEGRATKADLDERYSFRRNRTLTGSLSSGVSSVNEHHAELKSARIRAHDLRKHRRNLLMAFFGAAIVITVLGTAVWYSIAVPRVVLKGVTQAADASIYEQKIQSYLNEHFLERSRLTLNTGHLVEYLQDNGCPEVAEVSPDMSFSGLGSSKLSLTMRQPAVGWKTGATKLYVDVDGNAFQKNYFEEPGVEVVDQTGIEANNNQILASNRFLSFIGRTIGRFSAQGFTATKVILPVNTTRQLLVSLEGVSYPIIISVDRPAGEQVEDASRAIRYLTAKGIAVQYIDVRVSGRAYYK